MNYNFLISKYLPDATYSIEDRTYEGILWVGPGEKPSEELFKSFQKEEDRLARAAGLPILDQDNLMMEKQRQARDQAQRDLVPFQKKLGDWYESERVKFKKLKEEALELQARLALKETAMDCWREISDAQLQLNTGAQAYLEATKHMLSWDESKIPAEVLAKREEAHKVLSDGVLVYSDWAKLRDAEMPSREELREALLKGGEHLAVIRKKCQDIALKYPRPRRQHS